MKKQDDMAKRIGVCPTCGKPRGGMKQFEGYMARLFIMCVKYSEDQVISWKKKIDNKQSEIVTEKVDDVVLSKKLSDEGYTKQYTRIGDLKHWGLLYQRPEWWHQGIYQVTDKAKRFLAGRLTIAEKVIVSRGKVIETSEQEISFDRAIGKAKNEITDWILDWRQQYTEPPPQRDLFS